METNEHLIRELAALKLDMARKDAKQTEQIKAVFKRIDEQYRLTETVAKLATSTELLAAGQKRFEEDQRDIKTVVSKLQLKPGTRWDGLITQGIAVVVATVISVAVAKIF